MMMIKLLRMYATELGLSFTPKTNHAKGRAIKRRPTNQK